MKNFPLRDEFARMVYGLQESGIMDHWAERFIQESFSKYVENEEENVLTLNAMYFPFSILLIGISLSLVVFIVELAYHKYINWKSSRVIDLRNARMRREKWKKLYAIAAFCKCKKKRKERVLVRERII
jgi:hypothetical protein